MFRALSSSPCRLGEALRAASSRSRSSYSSGPPSSSRAASSRSRSSYSYGPPSSSRSGKDSEFTAVAGRPMTYERPQVSFVDPICLLWVGVESIDDHCQGAHRASRSVGPGSIMPSKSVSHAPVLPVSSCGASFILGDTTYGKRNRLLGVSVPDPAMGTVEPLWSVEP